VAAQILYRCSHQFCFFSWVPPNKN
jgi:hypothetical protein